MNNTIRIGLAAVAVVVIAIIAIQFLPDSNVGGPGPTDTPQPASTPAPSAAEGPSELPLGELTDLAAGTYFLSSFPVQLTFDVPAGWFSCSPSPVEQAVCYEPSNNQPVIAVSFLIVDNVVTDPCQDQEGAELLDPPVGPSVDDLVAAISSLEGYEATTPQDITVDGFDGQEFTLTAPDVHGCGATWATADRTTGMGAGEINLLRILDVDGVRVLISGAYHPVTPEADVAALQQVMDSVHIEP